MSIITEKQHEILTLIADHCCEADGFRRFWSPREKDDWSHTLNRTVWVDGAGFVSSLRALEAKGYITKKPNAHRYAREITEDGRLALEQYRESTEFYSKGIK